MRCVKDAVSREISIAYAYAIVKFSEGICICHVKVWVSPESPSSSKIAGKAIL